MGSSLKQDLVDWLGDRVDEVGFAPVDRFSEAPQAHHPERVVKGARTVVVLGKVVPKGLLTSPDYGLYMLHRTYHSVYMNLDELSLSLANFIEASGPHLAAPIPAFAPLVFHGPEPWGILSLKHAAVAAGLGAFGKSGLCYHPRHGAMLRLAAVVTSAELPGDPLIEERPCPEECGACMKACAGKAFNEEGAFNKLTCLGHTVKHAIYPLALKGPDALSHIERVINTAAYNYWLTCDECLKVCPIHKRPST